MNILYSLFGKSDAQKIADGKRAFAVNDVNEPKNLTQLPQLCLSPEAKFTAPATVDLRDYCTKTENQGRNPWCAAYTAAGYAENILWRLTDYEIDIDPAMIYREAKRIDDCPNTDGTTLSAVLQVLTLKGYFNGNVCKPFVIWGSKNSHNSIKYAIHKFGVCLLACVITEEWYLIGPNKTSITGKAHNEICGGHAILCCGYNRDGVIIQNSWGEEWGAYGFGLITWDALDAQFMYAAGLTNVLNGLKLNVIM